MIDRLKFRGKLKSTGGWRYAWLEPSQMFMSNFWQSIEVPHHLSGIDPATIGQWTGLTDKNGKEIYEGDILRSTENKWPEDGFPIGNIVPIDRCDLCGTIEYGDDWVSNAEYYEVIGNIHEEAEGE